MSGYYKRNPEKNCNKVRYFRTLRPEYYKEAKKRYRQEHLPELVATVKARKLLKIKRMPSWLTENHRAQIIAIYKLANAQSKASGVKMHVDHIVPLKGKNVSGLHVPWNLRVIPWYDNLSKHNKLDIDSH